ncbi:hypothetical protein HanXRQr2_Chr09g0413821 [Helianthus annuus]|uniref:Uncharacterized protein n=1 Tax=Helianthus annuus TaxID=4232 RepID=A0A9K3NAW1_HELAN|nr:hypothetical protein HanXRQr2_Chr09g0413821 [Helianthus annuus]KAJ0895386.1 hypothetical protein HanPSC8_Chr09g0399991 [Helianthus annuus]
MGSIYIYIITRNYIPESYFQNFFVFVLFFFNSCLGMIQYNIFINWKTNLSFKIYIYMLQIQNY